MSDPTIIQPDRLPDTREKGYSQARIQSGTLYVSGMSGRKREADEDGNWVAAGPDIETQTRQAFENIEIILDEVDKELTDIPKITSHIVDIQNNMEGHMRVIQEEIFPEEPYPCWTAVGSPPNWLEDLIVEVDVVVPLE